MDLSKISQLTIENDLHNFISSELMDAEVKFTADTTFKNLGISSMSIIEIILFIERKYQIQIPEEFLSPQNLTSIKNLANALKSNF